MQLLDQRFEADERPAGQPPKSDAEQV